MLTRGAASSGTGTGSSSTTLLVGNPNVGKSVIFGILTGRYATVSNYPGTTVELTSGRAAGAGLVIDLPGTSGLLPGSEDERVTRDVLLERLGDPGARVLLVADAKNLRRGLALALQLGELELPVCLAANMVDEARSRGIQLDTEALGKALGVPVLPTVATEREGVGAIKDDRVEYRALQARVAYGAAIEAAIDEMQSLLPERLRGRRGLALLLLAGDDTAAPWLGKHLGDRQPVARRIATELERKLGEPARHAITRARLSAAQALTAAATRRLERPAPKVLARLGDLAMRPLTGLPIAAAVLYAMYLFVGVLGAGTCVDFLENTLFAGYVTPAVDRGLRFLLPAGIEAIAVGPPGAEPGTGPGLLVGDYGVISMGLSYAVAIVLPIVGFFFVAFAVLEDSGYLPRLAVLLHRAFKVMGLNGKAVLPMILGLGCDTMATLTTRILPTRKERVIVTLLLALGVPCSAQLGVVLGMLSALSLTATMVWIGVVLAVMLSVGWLAARILPGDVADFILEIPPMRRPALGNILIKTVARIEWYLREAVPLFLAGTLLLWILDRLRLLAAIEQLAAPVVTGLLGLPTRATSALVIGFLRRDYGAAGLFDLYQGQLQGGAVPVDVEIQIVVAMTTITLFVPCVANFFVMIKERGLRTALAMAGTILVIAFSVGGALNHALRALWLP